MTTMRVVGECFFWYRLTRVFPDKFHRAVKRLCVCVCQWVGNFLLCLTVKEFLQSVKIWQSYGKNKLAQFFFETRCIWLCVVISTLTLLVGHHEGHLVCKKIDWCGAGMIICLVQLMSLAPQHLLLNPEWFTFLVPAYPGCPGQKCH